MTKQLMLGNEAIARGAWEAGVRLVSSYPGTPSTEITEYAAKYPEIYAEWAANEKVALEVCAGAAMGGARTMCCMKHVGVNVAADPLYTLSYTGVNAGLVLVAADDPGMHSSQNEQDSRMHARAAQVPMLEPADSAECLEFTKYAFDLSERYDCPVLLRTTTRIAHARSLAECGEREEAPVRAYAKDAAKWVMMPANARGRHPVVEARMDAIAAAQLPVNRTEMRSEKTGVICSGAVYQYVREALPEASVLKLGLVNPLPRALIEEFAGRVEELYVIEELEPVIEEQIRSWGVACRGKELTGKQGELSVRKLRAIFGMENPEALEPEPMPARPPVLCPGCPHRGVFAVLSKLKCTVAGDIGCYTLGATPPLSAEDTCLCMGASVGMAQGFSRARQWAGETGRELVGVIGDSTFLHSGVTSLLSAAYNRADITLIILDNTTTGMTGHQPNPATGFDIHGEPTTRIDLEALCRACGAASVQVVAADEMAQVEKAVRAGMAETGVSVVIARKPCALLDKKSRKAPLRVDAQACRSCRMCMKLGCPAISMQNGKASIDPSLCVGCGLCKQSCAFGAIGEREGE
ncbi:MAG: indolepyruvate ferredoxin oxidoreductase subunit alpha [Eubacteriales bacterium]|nr:indolepyruvate ferredoxin oxidoreductase subunit alpha [Eubacteriales bacterium]